MIKIERFDYYYFFKSNYFTNNVPRLLYIGETNLMDKIQFI